MEGIPSTQETGEQLLTDETVGRPALAGPDEAGVLAPSGMIDEDDADELIDIDRIEGRVKASMITKVGEIIAHHPEEALSIVRGWMYQQN